MYLDKKYCLREIAMHLFSKTLKRFFRIICSLIDLIYIIIKENEMGNRSTSPSSTQSSRRVLNCCFGTEELQQTAYDSDEDDSDSEHNVDSLLQTKPLASTEAVEREGSTLIKQGEFQECMQKPTLQKSDSKLSIDKRSVKTGEGQLDSQDQVSAPQQMSQFVATDYMDYPHILASRLPRNVQRLQAEFHFSQVQTIKTNDGIHITKQLERLPSQVESDNASTGASMHFETKQIMMSLLSDQKAKINFEPAVKFRSTVADEEQALLESRKGTTQEATVIPVEDHLDLPYIDEDDNTEAIDVLGSSPDCSDESSLDETSEEGFFCENADAASTMLCPKWEVSGVFGCKGGQLQKLDSDVQLLIPPGAVKSGTTVKVYAAVNANLEHLYDKLKGMLEKEEVIVSPAAEYWVGKDWKFEKPVTVILPHFLPSDYTEEEVRVYHITRSAKGGISLTAIPYRNSPRPKGGDSCVSAGSFGIAEDCVTVHTDHFSAVLCTHISKINKPKCQPQLFIRGSGTFTNCGSYQPVNLHVLIWDSRLHNRDIMKEEHGIKLEEYHKTTMVETSFKKHKWLRLSMVKSSHHPELRFSLDSEGKPISSETKTFDLEQMFKCHKCIKKGNYRLMQHHWSMELPPDYVKTVEDILIHVRVLMEPSQDGNGQTDINFLLHKKPSADVLPKSDDGETFKYVSKEIVLEVAQELGMNGSKTFFMELGLNSNQYDDKNRFNKSLSDTNLELLQVWCQSPQARDNEAVQKLIKCLQRFGRVDIAERVEQLHAHNDSLRT